MGLFSKILGKLGVGENDASSSPANPRNTGLKVDTSSSAARSSPQATMTEVDVVARLEEKARSHPEKLNWRTSIVDMLKLLDIDSSLSARKELAQELNAPRDLKDGSAEMNIWLNKTVLQRIAANGGNVPRDLLD